MSQLQKMKDEMKEEYKAKLATYLEIAMLTEELDKEIYELAIKRAAGCKLMLDGMKSF